MSNSIYNMIMVGPPGSAKTMLARRVATILPDLTFEESLEASKVCSEMGLMPKDNGLITSRPLRSPPPHFRRGTHRRRPGASGRIGHRGAIDGYTSCVRPYKGYDFCGLSNGVGPAGPIEQDRFFEASVRVGLGQ